MNVYQDKVSQLKKTTGWEIKDCEQFVSYVIEYLDACGYFIGDYTDDWVKYSDKDFGQWLIWYFNTICEMEKSINMY